MDEELQTQDQLGAQSVDSRQQEEDTKKLIKHCGVLYELAKKSHPEKELKKYESYYTGRYDSKDGASIPDSYNIIKPIINTKSSLALDAKITTQVVASVGALANIQELEMVEDMADVFNEILNHIKRFNGFNDFSKRIIYRADKLGIGIGKIYWDQDKAQGLGEVIIEEINPLNFFPDPSASELKDCNYVIIKNKYSALTLKSRYPQFIEQIDKLIKSPKFGDSNSNMDKSPSGTVTYKTDQAATQVYVYPDSTGLQKISESIDVYECYLKDDTTFIPDSDAQDSEIQTSLRIGFKYPYGRVIIYAGDNLIFEDKPIDEPTGFPFVVMNLDKTDSIWGQGDVEALCSIQDRINRAYKRLQTLIAKYVSLIMVDELSGVAQEGDLVNEFTLILDTGILGTNREPKVLTNNTLSEIGNLLSYLEALKKEAKEIARVNDMMVSGERPAGVNSGTMVQSLIESPMTSIREIQESFYMFLIEISNKAVTLAQRFYNSPRILRISEGKNFLSMTPGIQDQQMEIKRLSIEQGKLREISSFKTDLSICEFECEITAGQELSKSRGALANITLQLADKGFFGNPSSSSARKIVLQRLDYPNWRAIDEEIEAEKEKEASKPIAPPPIEKVAASLKDMPLPVLISYLQSQGITIPNPINQPMPEPMPEPMPTEMPEQELVQ